MSTPFDIDNTRDDDVSSLPVDAQALYHRLTRDGADSRERIAQIDQRLQGRIAQLSATQIAPNPEPESTHPGQCATAAPIPGKGTRRAPRYQTMRRWGTVLATAAVVITFVVILSVNAGLRSGGVSSHQTPPVIDLSGVPLTPVATPGPAARPLSQVITALHRQGNCNPVDPSSYFHVGDAVWVFVILKQPAQGHTISVHWFANGDRCQPAFSR